VIIIVEFLVTVLSITYLKTIFSPIPSFHILTALLAKTTHTCNGSPFPLYIGIRELSSQYLGTFPSCITMSQMFFIFFTAVYISKARSANNGLNPARIENGTISGDVGVTYELCAGILDKPEASIAEVAKQEVLEECGYDVPLENLELITICRLVAVHYLK